MTDNSVLKSERHCSLATHERRIVLHIGMPKTATTFLQYSIFKRTPSVNLIHRKHIGREVIAARRVLRSPPALFLGMNGIVAWTLLKRAISETKINVLSDENIVISPYFWQDRPPVAPAVVAGNLRRLCRHLRSAGLSPHILFTIRRQDHWFASRYAQSSNQFARASQADFEAQIKRILSRDYVTHGALLDYNALVEALEGVAPLTVQVYEDLINDADRWKQAVITAIQNPDISNILDASTKAEKRSNMLQFKETFWRLKNSELNGEPYITLHPSLSYSILKTYRASNKALETKLNLGLDRYKYF